MKNKNNPGFTLTELLIVVVIIILLLLAVMVGFRRQIDRGYDAKRKNDIGLIQRAFEEYYNDRNCYPDTAILNNCGGNELNPYLPKIPCDPQTKQPYLFVANDNPCSGYHTCAALKDIDDPQITANGCNGITGCGWGAGYNYCVAMGGAIAAAGFDPYATPIPTNTPTPSPTNAPTPTPTGPLRACAPNFQGCNSYADPIGMGCPVYWGGSCPPGACIIPSNWCAN